MNHLIRSVIILLMTTAVALSQGSIRGKVIDSQTKEPLAFANIVFNNNQNLTATSDIDGKFAFSSSQQLTVLSCSYVGYDKQLIRVKKGETNLLIVLKGSADSLDEVLIKPGENPANAIMRKVIANKEKNNPENIPSFKYTSYNKTIYDIRPGSKKQQDSAAISNMFKRKHLFIMESVSERKFLAPDISEEVVTATKVSGFKNPTFASLATDLQPFSFYQDNIKLFNIQYLNPISKGSLGKYNFIMEDTIFNPKDTVYIISFQPKKHKNFEGLKGRLAISSNKYAVQNVSATPFEKGKITIRIQQQYAFTDNTYWFPDQLNYTLLFDELGMGVDGRSYISKVQFNVPLRKKDFALESISIDKMAAKKDSTYWNQYRVDRLNPKELQTYVAVDSIGSVHHFDKILVSMEKVFDGRIPCGVIDFDITKSIIYNEHEGFRLGLGVYTNEKLFKNWVIGGFGGYGLDDHQWKYGMEGTYAISKKDEFTLSGKYESNLIETGGYGLRYVTQNLLGLRSYIARQMDWIRQSTVSTGFRAFRYTKWKLSLANTKTVPTYTYEFMNRDGLFTDYTNTSLNIDVRFAFKEKFVQSLNHRVSAGTNYPVLFVSYSRGLKNLLNGDFNYNKIEARLEQSFFTKNIGTTKYRLEAGYVDRPLPYGMMFTSEGSYDKQIPFIMPNTFQTMLPYEFLSDRYANVFLSHNFGSLLFQAGNFSPSLSLHTNIGWGNLSHDPNHYLLPYKVKDKVFTESGIQIDNILQAEYLHIGYVGFGVGVYYRYGAYANKDFADNVSFKFTTTFTIK